MTMTATILMYRKMLVDDELGVIQQKATVNLNELLNFNKTERNDRLVAATKMLLIEMAELIDDAEAKPIASEPFRCFFLIEQQIIKGRVATISSDLSSLMGMAVEYGGVSARMYGRAFDELVKHHEDRVIAVLNNQP
jgi:hypothetical protein